MESFELQSHRNIVKEGGVDVVENFKNKFKEIKIKGKRKVMSSLAMYTEELPRTYLHRGRDRSNVHGKGFGSKKDNSEKQLFQ